MNFNQDDARESFDYRFERKYVVTELSKYGIESMLKSHPAFFSEIFYERSINNIYFDTHNMKSLVDNISGISERLKTRVRWYGELLGEVKKPVLELKIKNGWYGRKEAYPIAPFWIEKGFCIQQIEEALEKSDLTPKLHFEMKNMTPTLLNRYRRKYFESADHKYRVTIDSDLEYYSLDRLHNVFSKKFSDYHNVVVELKYRVRDDNGASDISTLFPFRMTKSSKYVTGVERTGFW